MARKITAEITVPMSINVDGAPNAYGPRNRDAEALDFELNAHVGARKHGKVVGYLTTDGKTPIVQGADDPFPGFYISQTAYTDKRNHRREDPRRYVNAAEINYTLLARVARDAGVQLGDFCVVHSLRTRFKVFAIVGDSGNSKGAEGSLALLQRLGYDFKNGKSGGEDEAKIVVRYFKGTNPRKLFFFAQSDLEAEARKLDLDTDFSDRHRGDPGILVLDAIAHTQASLRVPRAEPFAPLLREEVPQYPRRLIKRDSDDVTSVRLIQQRLRDLGYTQPGRRGSKPLKVDGIFGNKTQDAVELFQIRHSDLHGRPLVVDGEVGSDTWGALFGSAGIHTTPSRTDDSFSTTVLEIAEGEIGVREDPAGSNKGKRVQQYQHTVGIDPGEPWCVAFVFFCFLTAAQKLKVPNPMSVRKCRTGGVLDLWNRARRNGVPIVSHDDALDDPGKVKPGMVFIISTGSGNGHTGLVVGVRGNRLETIEGNTNDAGAREGVGVFRRTGRTIASINRGFINFVI